MDIGRLVEIIGRIVVQARYVFHYIVPDGAGAGNTDNIIHCSIITIASPDANGDIGGVADGPVITKTLGGASFGRSRTIQLQWITSAELMIT